MRVQIVMGNQQDLIPVTAEHEQIVRKVLQEVARQFNLTDNTELSITFMDNSGIRELNRDYRGIDQATDVLSFAFDDDADSAGDIEFVSGAATHVLGDIIISTEMAGLQAAEYGHSLNREIGFLTLHGALHLLGFDHMTDEETKEMRGWEEKILLDLKLSRD